MQVNIELKQRIISAIELLIIVAYPVYAGGMWLFVFSVAVWLLCALEVVLSTKQFQQHFLVKVFAIVYITLGAATFVIIRNKFGVSVTAFLIIATYLTDTFAFIGGRTIGGPKLCPRISPKKTYSGFFCGIICSTITSYSFDLLYMNGCFRSIILSVILAIVSTIGDFYVSSVKRKLSIKDFSNLIPGHGGVLDRLDSILLTSIVFYILLETYWNLIGT